MEDTATKNTPSTTAFQAESSRKRPLADTPSSGSDSKSSSAGPYQPKRIKKEEDEEIKDGELATNEQKKNYAAPTLTKVYIVERESNPVEEPAFKPQRERFPELWVVGTYAKRAAAVKACRRERRLLGLQRRDVEGEPDEDWSWEGVALDLDEGSYNNDETVEFCRVVSVEPDELDSFDIQSDGIDFSEGEDEPETDVEALDEEENRVLLEDLEEREKEMD